MPCPLGRSTRCPSRSCCSACPVKDDLGERQAVRVARRRRWPSARCPLASCRRTDPTSCEPEGPGARHPPEGAKYMGNAGRHQATGRGRRRQLLARHRWYGALGMGAAIAALASAAAIMPGSHSPRPAARSCGLVRCTAIRPAPAGPSVSTGSTRPPHTARPPFRQFRTPPPPSPMPRPAPTPPAPSPKVRAHGHRHRPHPHSLG